MREQSDYAQAFCVLGVIDAALGRKEDAIRESRRAVELLPVTKDVMPRCGGASESRNHLRLHERERSCVGAARQARFVFPSPVFQLPSVKVAPLTAIR